MKHFFQTKQSTTLLVLCWVLTTHFVSGFFLFTLTFCFNSALLIALHVLQVSSRVTSFQHPLSMETTSSILWALTQQTEQWETPKESKQRWHCKMSNFWWFARCGLYIFPAGFQLGSKSKPLEGLSARWALCIANKGEKKGSKCSKNWLRKGGSKKVLT